MKYVLLMFLILAIPAEAFGQRRGSSWGSGGCSNGSCSPAGQFVPKGGWVEAKTDKGTTCYHWYDNGTPTAGYNPADKEYRTYDAGTNKWSEPTAPPWEKKSAQPTAPPMVKMSSTTVTQCACNGDPLRCDCDPFFCSCPGCRSRR